MTKGIKNDSKKSKVWNLLYSVETPETDMFFPLTPSGNKGANRVWKLVGWETWGRRDEDWTPARDDVKRDENDDHHFRVSSKNESHTRRAGVETKPVNKYVSTTTENQE